MQNFVVVAFGSNGWSANVVDEEQYANVVLAAPAVAVLCRVAVRLNGKYRVSVSLRALAAVAVVVNVRWVGVVKYGVNGVVKTAFEVRVVFVVVMVWFKTLYNLSKAKERLFYILSWIIVRAVIHRVVSRVRVKNALILARVSFAFYLFSYFFFASVRPTGIYHYTNFTLVFLLRLLNQTNTNVGLFFLTALNNGSWI